MTKVFLSYARGDDEPFVRRLYDGLKNATGPDGPLFDVWFDRVSMPSRALTFYQEIRDAIATRDRLILVVGLGAVRSDYVTQEWQFAYFAANKCINPIVRLDGLTPVGERLDGYELIPEDLRLLHAEDFRDDARFAEHLRNLVRQLSEPLPPVGKLVAVPELPPGYRAQPDRLRVLHDMLLVDLRKPVVVTGPAARVGMQGMGGIGKSVLANALAHHPEVQRAFRDNIFWVCLGGEPHIEELQQWLVCQLGGEPIFTDRYTGKEKELRRLLKEKLRELLADKSSLLILDDVWERDHAEAFNVVGPLGRILLTTRDAGLVTVLAARENHYRVELPTEAEAEAILVSTSEVPPDQLPAEAGEIIEESGRLPLALALCGGMVHGGVSWRSVLQALKEHDLEFLSAEHPGEGEHENAWKAMDISLRVLPQSEQERFSELAVFLARNGAAEAAVATLWQHTGGLSSRQTEALLAKFIRRSLVLRPSAPDDEGTATVDLHDMLRHFATGMSIKQLGSVAALHERLLDAYRAKCPDGWASGPNDGYFLENVCTHCYLLWELSRDSAPLFELVSPAWRLRKLGVFGSDVRFYENDLHHALKASREMGQAGLCQLVRYCYASAHLRTLHYNISDRVIKALVDNGDCDRAYGLTEMMSGSEELVQSGIKIDLEYAYKVKIRAYGHLCAGFRGQGKTAEMKEVVSRATRLALSLANQFDQANMLVLVASRLCEIDELAEATTVLERTLAISRGSEWRRSPTPAAMEAMWGAQSQIAAVYAAADRPSQALDIVDAMKREPGMEDLYIWGGTLPRAKTQALCSISQHMHRRGKPDLAHSVLGRALALVDSEDSGHEDMLLKPIASAFAVVGDLDAAMEAVGRIESASERCEALCSAANVLRETGDEQGQVLSLLEAARDNAETAGISSLCETAAMYRGVAQYDIASRLLKTAIERAGRDAKSWGIWRIAHELGQLGKWEEAHTWISSLKKSEVAEVLHWLVSGIAEYAKKKASHAAIEVALQDARQVHDSEKQSQAFRSVAGAMAALGRGREAMDLAEQISDDTIAGYAMSEVVVEAARTGNREALTLAKAIEHGRQRYFATREAAIELFCLGDASMLDELVTQKSPEAEEGTSKLLAALASEFALRGKRSRANELLEKALQGLALNWGESVPMIARVYARLGDMDRVNDLVDGLRRSHGEGNRRHMQRFYSHLTPNLDDGDYEALTDISMMDAIVTIGLECARVGATDEADSLTGSTNRGEAALIRFAAELSGTLDDDSLDEVIETAMSIGRTRGSLWEWLAEFADRASAATSAEQRMGIVDDLVELYEKDNVFVQTARQIAHCIQLGMTGPALERPLDVITNMPMEHDILKFIICDLARLGGRSGDHRVLEHAAKRAGEISDTDARYQTMLVIMRQWLKIGQTDQAVMLLQEMLLATKDVSVEHLESALAQSMKYLCRLADGPEAVYRSVSEGCAFAAYGTA